MALPCSAGPQRPPACKVRGAVGRGQEHLSETHGLQLTGLVEHQRLPLSYTLQAIKA